MLKSNEESCTARIFDSLFLGLSEALFSFTRIYRKFKNIFQGKPIKKIHKYNHQKHMGIQFTRSVTCIAVETFSCIEGSFLRKVIRTLERHEKFWSVSVAWRQKLGSNPRSSWARASRSWLIPDFLTGKNR